MSLTNTEIILLMNYVEAFGLVLAISSAQGCGWVTKLEKCASSFELSNLKKEDWTATVIGGAVFVLPFVLAGASAWYLIGGVLEILVVIVFGLIVLVFKKFSRGSFTTSLGVLIASFCFLGKFFV